MALPGPDPAGRGLPRWLLAALGVLALASLVVELGFHLGASALTALHALDALIALLFGADLVLALARSPRRGALIRARWHELLLLVLFALSLAAFALAGSERATPLRGDALAKAYLVALQLFLVVNLVIRGLRAQEGLLGAARRPELLLIGSFVALILAGAVLLSLPRALAPGAEPLSLLDALFTSTSASCVTGLAVRDTGADFSRIGQLVILGLFQIGGLGIITFVAVGSILASKRFSIPQMVTLREVVGAPSVGDVRRQVMLVVVLMLAIEAVGSALFFLALPAAHGGVLERAYWSVFHSVSAFCNAGFSLQGDSLQSMRGLWGVNLTAIGLILVGGLGVPVVRDLLAYRPTTAGPLRRLPFFHRLHAGRAPARLGLQSKLTLVTGAALLAVGALGFAALEWRHALSDLPFTEAVLVSAFHGVTPRTAGFDTVPVGELRDSTLLLTMGLMAIGAGPVSTGGGMKTVTFAVLVLTVRAMMSGRERIEAAGRSLPSRVVRTAVSVFVLYLGAAALVTFALTLTDPGIALKAHAFEAVSALSTVGLSTGITTELGAGGKLVLCAAMLVGRVGPLSLALSIFRSRRAGESYTYPEEELVVG